MLAPSSAGLESTTLLSGYEQNGHLKSIHPFSLFAFLIRRVILVYGSADFPRSVFLCIHYSINLGMETYILSNLSIKYHIPLSMCYNFCEVTLVWIPFQIRQAVEADIPLILRFIRQLAAYETF
jgi:hypothetical protein